METKKKTNLKFKKKVDYCNSDEYTQVLNSVNKLKLKTLESKQQTDSFLDHLDLELKNTNIQTEKLELLHQKDKLNIIVNEVNDDLQELNNIEYNIKQLCKKRK